MTVYGPDIGNSRRIEDGRGLSDTDFLDFEVLAAVDMKNAVVWDIKPQFVLHRRHITSPLQSPAS
jgi:hypothetical protein